jgi:radical SAM protein with 4Fe4S-binding SPASM domain
MWRLPYCVQEHISVQRINNTALYLDLRKGNYIKLPWEVHEWIVSDKKTDIGESELLKYLNSIMRELVDSNFIEPDFTKIDLGKSSFYISKGTLQVQEKVDYVNLYIDSNSIIKPLIDKHFFSSNSNISFVGIPETQHFDNLMTLRRIIISSVSDITYLRDIGCKEIRIEIHNALSTDDIDLLTDTIKKRRVHIALPYSLDRSIANEILRIIKKLNNKNLSVTYDICIILPRQLNGDFMDKSIFVEDGIEHQALKNIKITCGAGANRFFIDANGDIFPCYRMRFSEPMGNIFMDTPEDFINKRKLVKSDFPKACQLCSVKYFCSNGCQNEQNNYSYLYCQQIKKILESELQK